MYNNSQDIKNKPAGQNGFLQARIEELEKQLLRQGEIEQMAEESEQRFRQILNLSHDSIVIYEKETGEILEANPRLAHTMKYNTKDVMGQPVYRFFNSEQQEMIKLRLRENLPDVYEAVMLDGDGQPHEFEISSKSCTYRGKMAKIAAVRDISYRRHYEKVLREKEEKFRSLTENINDSIILADRDEILYLNPSTLPVLELGNDPPGCLNHIVRSIHPDDRHIGKSLVDSVADAERQARTYQFRVVSGNGGERWVWSRVFLVAPDNPDNNRTVILSSDITEMREREEARKKTEISASTAKEKYKVLTSLLPEIIIETDLEGRLTFVNLKAIDVFEYGSDFYVKNLNFMELISTEDRQKCRNAFRTIMEGGTVPETEYTAITRSGRRFPVMIHATRMYANNDLIGLSIVMFDMKTQKYAERKVLNYQENMLFLSNSALKFLTFSNDDDIFIFIGKRLSKIVPRSVVVVFSYDQANSTSSIRYISGIYSCISPLMDILGQPPEDFAIKLPHRFKTKYLSNRVLMKLNSLEDATESNWPKESVGKIQEILKVDGFYSMGMSRDGKLYGGLMIATRQENEALDAQLIETFVYQAGIALHRKQIENELIKAKLAAEESDRLKSAFLANMSHEVRTPLNGILGLAQLLLKSDISPDMRKDYVRMIVDSGSSLLTLIEDIMDVSKIEAKQMKIKYKPFHLNTLIDQLYSIFLANPLYMQKNSNGGQNIELRYSKMDEDICLISDPDRLRQVFVNLIGNALKFTQHGFVEFGYRVKKKQILFHVKDSGIGIPGDKTESIFDRFTQVDGTLARKFGGSGLGLAISKGLIDLLNGEIWCESEREKGSSFFFTIPYHPTTIPVHNEAAPTNNITEYDWSDYTVLIVEDDSINFKVIEAMLRRTKIHLLHADNGMKAINAVQSNSRVDIVLMDMHLPELSGLEATRLIRGIRPDIPIIAQTANAMSEDKDKCIEAGCVDYISKPIDMGQLFTKISRYLPV